MIEIVLVVCVGIPFLAAAALFGVLQYDFRTTSWHQHHTKQARRITRVTYAP